MRIYFRNKHNGIVSQVNNKSELIRFVEQRIVTGDIVPTSLFNKTINQILRYVPTNDYFIMKGRYTK